MDTPHGVYNWSETEVGQTNTQPCEFGAVEASPNGMATRQCDSPRGWRDVNGGQCITRNTALIQQLGEVRIYPRTVNSLVHILL